MSESSDRDKLAEYKTELENEELMWQEELRRIREESCVLQKCEPCEFTEEQKDFINDRPDYEAIISDLIKENHSQLVGSSIAEDELETRLEMGRNLIKDALTQIHNLNA